MRSSQRVHRHTWLLLIVGVVLSLAGVGTRAQSEPLQLPAGLIEVSPASPMPTFRLPGVRGASVHAGDLHGKVVVVRFWATW